MEWIVCERLSYPVNITRRAGCANKRRIYKMEWIVCERLSYPVNITRRAGCANKRRIYKWIWEVCESWSVVGIAVCDVFFLQKKQSIYISSILLSRFSGIWYWCGFLEFENDYFINFIYFTNFIFYETKIFFIIFIILYFANKRRIYKYIGTFAKD